MPALYPLQQPYKTQQFAVTPSHVLYCAEYGNPKGIPVIYVHGGPGFASSDNTARHYDPAKYRIILLHQRGSGKSTPLGALEDNNTQVLINDMEYVRQQLGVDQWLVTGGSWGSTLALLYTQQHPQHVLGLILRGVFLSRRHDTFAFLNDYSLGAQKYPEKWAAFKQDTDNLIAQAGFNKTDFADAEYGFNYNACYAALMKHRNPEIQAQAAKQYYRWEIGLSYVDPTPEKCADSVDGLNMGRLEPGFLAQQCFLRDNQILEDIKKIHSIGSILLYIVQGKQDYVCPLYQATDLIEAWTKAGGMLQCQFVDAGHSMGEPEVGKALVAAADDFAKFYLSATPMSAEMHRRFINPVNSAGVTHHVGAKVRASL